MSEREPKFTQPEIEKKQEEVVEGKEDEYSLSPEEREQVMQKLEELLSAKAEDLYVRFVYDKQFEDYLREDQISAEIAPLESFLSILRGLDAAKKRSDKSIGFFWGTRMEETTRWPISPGYVYCVETTMKQVASIFKEESIKLKKQGEMDWKQKARETAVRHVFKGLSTEFAINPLVKNFLKRDSLPQLKKELEDIVTKAIERKGEMRDKKRSEVTEKMLDTEPTPEDRTRLQIAQFLLELIEEKDPERYLAKNFTKLRKFISLAWNVGRSDILPYQLMLIFKPDKEKLKETYRIYNWKYFKGELDKSLLAAVALVPERTFVQEQVEKLEELYKIGEKQVLFPLFGPRLNPKWPRDKEVLERMKERIEEIQDSVKKEDKELG